MEHIADNVALCLLEANAVKLSPKDPFTWASGLKSPIYCDNRVLLSYPEKRDIIKNGLVKISAYFDDFDVVAGVATAGIPHGMLLADALGKPFIYVRDKPKAHGRQNAIEGNLQAGQSVLVVEDLISTGGSALKAVDTLEAAGAIVVGVVAIFSYGFEKATTEFRDRSLHCKTLSNYLALINVALKHNFIDAGDFQALEHWMMNPEKWSEERHTV